MIRLVLLAAAVAVVAFAVWRWRKDRRDDALARARSAFFLVTPTPQDRGPSPDRLRSLSVGEDGLRVRIPADWNEQPTTTGCEARASSGRVFQARARATLRPEATVATLTEELQASPEGREGRIDVLTGDRLLLKHVRSGASGAPHGLTYCWTLAAVRPTGSVVLAELSLAVPLEAADAITLDDLALLEREIRNAAI